MTESLITKLSNPSAFVDRHLGPDAEAIQEMLTFLGEESLESFCQHALPPSIQLQEPLALPAPMDEVHALAKLKAHADNIKVNKSFIGLGYYGTYTPAVIQRNLLENPGWYTAYTPYQPEISQGRLEMLLNFQQMTMDLTAMAIANASLLDEATAAAEAMSLCKRSNRKDSKLFFVDEQVLPQTLDVLRTRAEYFGFNLAVGDPETELEHYDCFGLLLQYPGADGRVRDLEPSIQAAHQQGALVCVGADLLSLLLLKAPGDMGADVVFGSAQRFGVPMGFGGPHAAYFATTDKLKRSAPGRIIGVSVDSRGKPAYRMAMQTREQHIRREKATSNICTAQALLANIAASYAIYHGPDGLKRIAQRVNHCARVLALGLQQLGYQIVNQYFFDTICIDASDYQADIESRALEAGYNLRYQNDNLVLISVDETTSVAEIEELWRVFIGRDTGLYFTDIEAKLAEQPVSIPAQLNRQSEVLSHPVFNRYHAETDMLRYLKRLENRDFSLVHGMIPLGSCTMKLNASAEMMPISWPEFAHTHPFAPKHQVQGYLDMIAELEAMLVEITGYDRISMQPNSGAQGEYTGLLAIRKYQQSIGQGHRNVCLIPSSAHGTNPASAAMAAMKVVVVNCDDDGNVDIDDLRTKAEQYSNDLSCLMATYPSTHGVFEDAIIEICDIIHLYGGQVYMDGANLNAQVGLAKPGLYGSDVSHLNLHKTFAIPHGGGGPGMGPIGVKAHLSPFLPNHVISPIEGDNQGIGAVSAAPYGSSSILPISWMYCVMLGAEGLTKASQVAILSANYIAEKLADHYPVLYRGRNQRVAHECIIDIRPIKENSGISEEDIAKRLMDFGFHAPTMSFPVPGTLMIEPTESESKTELDRFIQAMIQIRKEIAAVETNQLDPKDNPLKNAPHTQLDLVEEWQHPYSREQAVFPDPRQRQDKFWPAVNRVDNVYGDRHLVCSCPPMDAYKD